MSDLDFLFSLKYAKSVSISPKPRQILGPAEFDLPVFIPCARGAPGPLSDLVPGVHLPGCVPAPGDGAADAAAGAVPSLRRGILLRLQSQLAPWPGLPGDHAHHLPSRGDQVRSGHRPQAGRRNQPSPSMRLWGGQACSPVSLHVRSSLGSHSDLDLFIRLLFIVENGLCAWHCTSLWK